MGGWGGIVDFGFRIQGPGSGGRLHRSLTLQADMGQLMYPGPVLQRSYWETGSELKLKWLMPWHRVARESAARKERLRQKRSQERRAQKDIQKHIARAVEATKAVEASKAQDVTDGVVAADGVDDGAAAPESLDKRADRTVAEHSSRY